MSFPVRLFDALCAQFGPRPSFQVSDSPASTQARPADVVEFRRRDTSVVYVTVGLSREPAECPAELMVHCASRDPLVARMLGQVGAMYRTRHFGDGATLRLGAAFSDPPFFAVGFLDSGRRAIVEHAPITLLQVIGLTEQELRVAERDSLYALEAAFWADGVGLVCAPDRPTSPAALALSPARPSDEALGGLSSPHARIMVAACVWADADTARGVRRRISREEARILARTLGRSLHHPRQLMTLLAGLEEHPVAELSHAAHRLLQLDPEHHLAPDCYAEALVLLAAIEGADRAGARGRYAGAQELTMREAGSRRRSAGLPLIFGKTAD